MAIQRRNSECILETVTDSSKLDEVYYLETTFNNPIISIQIHTFL